MWQAICTICLQTTDDFIDNLINIWLTLGKEYMQIIKYTGYKLSKTYAFSSKYFNHFQAKRSKTVLTDDNNKTLFFPANFQGCSSGGLGEISLHLHLFPLRPLRPLNRNSQFWREHYRFLRAHYLEWTYFQPFSIIILICALFILFPWDLLYIIDAFRLFSLITKWKRNVST